MWHLLRAHQQESFLPFSSLQSLSCCLRRVAKRSTPKPSCPLSSPPKSRGPLSSPPKSRDPLPSSPKPHGPPSGMAASPWFKSHHQSSSAAPFPTPPTISYTCQHTLFFKLYWAAIVSPGRCGPMAWSQSSPSSHAGPVTRGSCLPVTSWVEITPIPPPTKPGHSYLTHPLNQLEVVDMVNDHARG